MAPDCSRKPSSNSSDLLTMLFGAHDGREYFCNRAIELSWNEFADLDYLVECAGQRLILHDRNRRQPRDRNDSQRVLARALCYDQRRLIESTAVSQSDREVSRVG